jgi:hypothetical protein
MRRVLVVFVHHILFVYHILFVHHILISYFLSLIISGNSMMIAWLLPLLTVIEIMLRHYDACDVETCKTIYS